MDSLEKYTRDVAGGKKRKLSPTRFEQTLKGASPVEYEDEYEKSNASLQLAWSAIMDEDGHYKTSPFYRKVKCLLISWDKEHDDLHTEEEVSNLGSLFEDTFHYKVKKALLTKDPKHSPYLQAARYIIDFLWEEDDPNSLLVVYYAGHGAPKPRRGGRSEGLTLTSARNVLEDDDEDENDIVWGKIEDHFQTTRADVLEIFDCCYAGDLGRTRQGWGTRSFEFLGACSTGNVTRSPGPESFTTALIWALKALKQKQGMFTVSELSRKIREAPGFPSDQKPVHFDRAAHGIERIVLTPLAVVGDNNDAPSPGCDDTTPQGLLQLNFIFAELPTLKMITNFATTLNRAMKKGQMPVNRIAWGGLSTWGGSELSANRNLHVIEAVKKFKVGLSRRKSKEGNN